MQVSIRVLAGLGASALAFQAAPAAAQYMPHLDPSLYANVMMMNSGPGTCGPMSESEIDEARLPAPVIMQSYFDARQSGAPVAGLFKLNGKTSWTLGAVSVGEEGLDGASDPLAVAGNTLDADTLRFFRAGTHQTALGQWLVNGPSGDVAGLYQGEFTRERGEWKLHKLQVFRAADRVSPILHYCSEPGDLDERRVNATTAQVGIAERQVERAERRFERDEARAVEAEQAAADKPDSSSRQARATERRTRADVRRVELAEARTALAEAQENKAEAEAERAAFLALTTPASGARSFRGIDDEGKPIEAEAGE